MPYRKQRRHTGGFTLKGMTRRQTALLQESTYRLESDHVRRNGENVVAPPSEVPH